MIAQQKKRAFAKLAAFFFRELLFAKLTGRSADNNLSTNPMIQKMAAQMTTLTNATTKNKVKKGF